MVMDIRFIFDYQNSSFKYDKFPDFPSVSTFLRSDSDHWRAQ